MLNITRTISTQTNSGDPVVHFNQSLHITDTESFPNFNSQIIRKKAYTSLSTFTNMWKKKWKHKFIVFS